MGNVVISPLLVRDFSRVDNACMIFDGLFKDGLLSSVSRSCRWMGMLVFVHNHDITLL